MTEEKKSVNNPETGKLPKKRKWLKRVIFVVLFLLIVTISSLLVLIYTSLGTSFTQYAVNKWVDGVKIEKLEGTFQDLSLTELTYQQDGVFVEVKQANVKINLSCLLSFDLCIDSLESDGITVKIEETESSEPSPPTTEKLSLPIGIYLDNLLVKNVQLEINQTKIKLPFINGQANWLSEKITINELIVNDGYVEINEMNHSINESTETQQAQKTATKTSLDEVNLKKIIDDLFAEPILTELPNVFIPVDVDINQVSLSQWSVIFAADEIKIPSLKLQGSIDDSIISITHSTLDSEYQHYQIMMNLKSTVTLKNQWTAISDAEVILVDQENHKEQQLLLHTDGELLGNLSFDVSLSGVNDVKLDGNVQLAEPYLPINIELHSDYFQWPLFGESEYAINKLSLNLNGAVDKFTLNSQAQLSTNLDNLSEMNYQLQLDGSNQSLRIDHLMMKFPEGIAELDGELSWSDLISWNTNLSLQKLNLEKVIPDYPINLDGKFNSKGQVDPNELSRWKVEIKDTSIIGSVNHKAFKLDGNLNANPDQIISDNLTLDWGNNHLLIKGDSLTSLNTHVDFKELNIILPNLSGSIKGDSKLKGNLEQVEIDNAFTVSKLKYDTVKIEKATINNKINFQDNQLSGDLTVNVANVIQDDLLINSIKLTLAGNEQKHRLELDVNGQGMNAKIALDAGITPSKENWIANMQTIHFQESEFGSWNNKKPFLISYNFKENNAVLSGFCLDNKDANICLEGPTVVGEEGDVILNIKNVNLNQFLSNEEYTFNGKIDSDVNILWDDKKTVPTMKLTMKGTGLKVTENLSGKLKSITIPQLEVKSDINADQVVVDLAVKLNNQGGVNSHIVINDPMDKKSLVGTLVIPPTPLNAINILLGDEDSAKGDVRGNLNLSGTLLSPKVTGQLDLSVNELQIQDIKTDINKINATLRFNGSNSTLSGAIITKKGKVDINGHANWAKLDHWTSEIEVKGDELRVEIPDLVYLYIEPNIKVTADPEQLNISGRVNIPKAKVTVKSLPPSVVDVSSDEVMLDKQLKPIEKPAPLMKINSKVLVSLGNDVSIDAYGLKANLSGHLYVEQSIKGITGAGTITIPKGRFHAYGQDLVIQKGEIIFAGPIDNPRLNIEAIRNPEAIEGNIKAGLRITGLADKPEVSIFSDPAMSQQEALSYILRGQGLDSSSQSENDLMTAALIGLGTAESGRFLGGVGEMFGIKDLELDTTGVGNSQKVVVSGNLTPDLQLKYSMGIFDALATFTLRYRLLPKLYIEASTGVDQTIDLIYQFER